MILIGFIKQALRLSSTLLFGSTGEIITEKSGNLNLGTPGIMAIGGISGVVGAYLYESKVEQINPFLGIIITFAAALLGSLLASLIYSFLTVTLKTNQNVTGLALTTFGTGLSNFIGGIINKAKGGSGVAAFPEFGKAYQTSLPFADKLGSFGEAFLSLGFMTYLGIIIALVTAIVITRTRIGLNLRAVGENPSTADAAGINVDRYKYIAISIGGMISGLGGLHYVMDCAGGNWSNNILGQLGWLSVALVIFAVWKPQIGIFGSIIFGGLYILSNYLTNVNVKTQVLLTMLPYVVTIIVLVIISMRNKRDTQPPASLGLSYFREER